MNHFLGIGIDDYPNCNSLNNCVQDVGNIIDVLNQKYKFEDNNIVTLYNEYATRENIFNQLEQYIESQGKDDNFIFYFGGHGDYDERLDTGYLLPHEAVPFAKSSYFEYSSLYNYIKAFSSRHVVVISDSCYSGTLFPERSIVREGAKDRLFKIPSRYAITSGRVEPVSDGEPGKNSPFAKSLITNLSSNTDNMYSVLDLSNVLIQELASSGEQIPRGGYLSVPSNKGGQFMFEQRPVKSYANAAIANSHEERSEVTKLIDALKETNNRLEEAENKGLVGTVRKIESRKKSILELLDSAVDEEFLILSSGQIYNPVADFGESIEPVVEKIEYHSSEKSLAVKNQKYELAADHKDYEFAYMMYLDEKLGNLDLSTFIDLTPRSTIDSFNKIRWMSRFTSKYASQEIMSKYEQLCKEIYKLTILKDQGVVDEYKHKVEVENHRKSVKILLQDIKTTTPNRNYSLEEVKRKLTEIRNEFEK